MTPRISKRTRRAASLRALALLSALSLPVAFPAAAQAASAAPTLLGRTDAASSVTLALSLPSRDPAGLADFIARVGTRGDALYHHYLTPAEYAARFGASEADYDAVVAWARAQGLQVGERYAARTVLSVSGPASAMEAAFGTQFNDYRDAHGQVFAAGTGAAHLPEAIAAKVNGVVGLTGATRFAPLLRRLPAGVHPLTSGHGPGGGFNGADLRAIYNVPAQLFGPAQTLAVFEQGGFTATDVTTYLMRNNLPLVPVTVRPVDNYNGSVNSADVEAEAVLDIDMQIAMNPKAAGIVVYEQGTSPFPVALVDSLSAMASDNTAKSISISYGQDEAIQGTDALNAENAVLEQMTAQGQAVFASAGDQGAYGRTGYTLNVEDPGSQPFVTSVGGTTVFPGKHESYHVEEVWNDLGAGYGATGGGVSAVWPIPGWQTPGGYSVIVPNGGSTTMRNVPDVASIANPLTGVSIYSAINGGWLTIGGTSVSAPIWAGFYSLVGAASQGLGFGNPGFANPGLYVIATFRGLVYTMFNDVVDGNNGSNQESSPGFTAGVGYDNTTGWGSFIGGALLADFVTPPNGSTPPPAPTGIKATSTSSSITLTWKGAAGDSGFLVETSQVDSSTVASTLIVNAPTATITGLLPSTKYYIQVYAISPQGTALAQPKTVPTKKAS